MKKLPILLLLLLAAACSQAPAGGAYGEKFENKGAVDFKSALQEYRSGKDSVYIISGTIQDVCQGEGCWLSFQDDSSEFMVNTHEKFSMPKDSKGKQAIARGRFVETEEGEIEFQPSGVIIR